LPRPGVVGLFRAARGPSRWGFPPGRLFQQPPTVLGAVVPQQVVPPGQQAPLRIQALVPPCSHIGSSPRKTGTPAGRGSGTGTEAGGAGTPVPRIDPGKGN